MQQGEEMLQLIVNFQKNWLPLFVFHFVSWRFMAFSLMRGVEGISTSSVRDCWAGSNALSIIWYCSAGQGLSLIALGLCLQLGRPQARQINRLRTYAAFQGPRVLKKKSIYETVRVSPPREDTLEKRSSWMSLLIIYWPFHWKPPRMGEILHFTFRGSETLQGEAESMDVCKIIKSGTAVLGAPSDCSTVPENRVLLRVLI